jgi:hypothetical protein
MSESGMHGAWPLAATQRRATGTLQQLRRSAAYRAAAAGPAFPRAHAPTAEELPADGPWTLGWRKVRNSGEGADQEKARSVLIASGLFRFRLCHTREIRSNPFPSDETQANPSVVKL